MGVLVVWGLGGRISPSAGCFGCVDGWQVDVFLQLLGALVVGITGERVFSATAWVFGCVDGGLLGFSPVTG